MRASEQDGTHPRPQLCRDGWTSLDGDGWRFAYDDQDVGEAERWFDPAAVAAFDRDIRVPFPPESPASGIGDPAFHPVVWYRREVTPAELLGLGERIDQHRGEHGAEQWGEHGAEHGGGRGHHHRRVLVHFGAVDHSARVWFDGHLVAEHVGGQTPFTADVTAFVPTGDTTTGDTTTGDTTTGDTTTGDTTTGGARDGHTHVLVVRAEDDPLDVAQPRGKQDWREQPHDIWYHRTTGIWQPVWTERVPALHIADLAWLPQPTAGNLRAELTLSARPRRPLAVSIEVSHGDETLAHVAVRFEGPRSVVDIALPAVGNAQDRDRLLWSPDHPALLDAAITVRESGEVLDRVRSYVGMREVGVGEGHFLLNGRPCYLRSVLDQGYREDTHLAVADTDSLRRDVELIKAMGFNAVRVHQRAADPRFLFWADRLGLMVWAETANAYEFSPDAVDLLTREWLDLVRRGRSHPCIVTWVPLNESWGVPEIASDRRQQQYAVALASLTRALDPTRPVLSNEGWEHLDSDVLGVHDYTTDPQALRAHYADAAAITRTLEGRGPQGRPVMLGEAQRRAFDAGVAPLMVTEFGGISLTGGARGWGYAEVESETEYAAVLRDLFRALHACEGVVGFCYTQFADTAQETNGLVRADRSPKISVESINQIVTSP